MLRRTAARAFGAGRASSDVPPALHQTHRGAAVERLFGDLHRRLADLVQKRMESESDAAAQDESAGGAARDAPDSEVTSFGDTEGPRRIQVTRPRALSEGVEFALVGPGCSCRFVNTMTGFIRVSTHGVESPEEASEPARAEVLSVHPYWGTFRPILKPVPLRTGEEGRRGRTAFCYTSAEELAAHYLDLVANDE